MSSNSYNYASYLQQRAKDLGVKLPPVGRTPKHWPKSFRAPTGDPIELSDDPNQFLRRVGGHVWPVMTILTILRVVEGVASAFIPVVMAGIINGILVTGFTSQVWIQFGTFLVLIALIAAGAALADLWDVGAWINSALIATRSIGHRATRAGRVTKEKEAAGDIVTSLAADSEKLGMLALMIPNAIGSLVAIIVAIVVMFNISVPMGLIVAIGMPVSMLIIALVTRPLERRLSYRREKLGELTVIASDAVIGLRVLRGIGGEDVFHGTYQKSSQEVSDAGKAAAVSQALLSTMASTLPQIIAMVVVSVGAVMTFNGQLEPGDYAAFFAYAWMVRGPIGMTADLTYTVAAAWPGVKKMSKMWKLTPGVTDGESTAKPNWEAATLSDQKSGVAIHPGKYTGVACTVPEVSAALARRLARATDENLVTVDGVDVRDLPVEDVRKAVYLSDATIQVFGDTLQGAVEGAEAPLAHSRGVTELVYREKLEQAIDVEGSLWQKEEDRTSERLARAIAAADADDVVSSLSGVTGTLTEKGRNVSGGQRQRIALARALYADAPILVLVQPTSAVDAHTEAHIAEHIGRERGNKTTVVMTTSPLILGKCDEVIVLNGDGEEVGRGTHEELLATSAQYRCVIDREVN